MYSLVVEMMEGDLLLLGSYVFPISKWLNLLLLD